MHLNPRKLTEYVTWGNILGEETLFNGINQVEPGHYVKINSFLKVIKSKYFDLRDSFSISKQSINFKNLKEQVEENIISHTVSDVDYGTQLSVQFNCGAPCSHRPTPLPHAAIGQYPFSMQPQGLYPLSMQPWLNEAWLNENES